VGSVEESALFYCNHDMLAFDHRKEQCSVSRNGRVRIMGCVV
jgi:hypothetical protein